MCWYEFATKFFFQISDTLQLLRNTNAAGAGLEKEVKRPRTWGEVNFKCVPLQEGEDDGNADVESESDELPPIPDPLEVSGMDLRKTQELYSSGRKDFSIILCVSHTF